jgi:hypothetical protein
VLNISQVGSYMNSCCRNSLPQDGRINSLLQAAQFIVRHYQSSLPASPAKYGSTAAASNAGSTRVLKILFITRSTEPAYRQVLNIKDLVEQCQGWRYTDPASSIQFAAECGVWQPGADLLSNIAAVRSADVVIGRHGASMANAFFMPEGGAREWCAVVHLTTIRNQWPDNIPQNCCAVVELFTPGYTLRVHHDWLDQEDESQMQWWGLTVEVGARSSTVPLQVAQVIESSPQHIRHHCYRILLCCAQDSTK